jgi:prophage maintenance system killer protein
MGLNGGLKDAMLLGFAALAVALEYLSLNDYEIILDNKCLADPMRDLILYKTSETNFFRPYLIMRLFKSTILT